MHLLDHPAYATEVFIKQLSN